jgi:hypothetical protein
MFTHCDISVDESAEAESIFDHLTFYEGEHDSVPFQQFLTQSAFEFANASSVDEDTFQFFLMTAKVISVQEAQALSLKELRVTNYVQISDFQ